MTEYNDKLKHYPLRNRKRQKQSNDEQKKKILEEKIASLTFCIESDEEEHPLKEQKRKGRNQSTSLRNERAASLTFCIESEDEFSSDCPEMITGNDSFSFNEEMKFGGYYCHGNILRFDYNDDAGENSVQNLQTGTKNFWLESPSKEKSNEIRSTNDEHEISFDLQADGVLTSTLITDLQSPEVNENALLCNISKIEEILNSSTKTIQNELIQLKEKVARTTVEKKISDNKVKSTVPTPKENILKKDSKIEVLNVEVLSTPLITSNCPDRKVSDDVLQNKVSNMENLDDNDDAIENQVEGDMPIREGMEIENALIDTTLTIQPLIKKKNDYEIVEANLKLQARDDGGDGDDGGEKASEDEIRILRQNLTDALSPEEGETVAKYMDRTIPMLFDVDFFIDCISWKPEKEEHRLYFETTSNILKCWKDAYQKAFGIDKNEKEFKHQFRRFKMAKRAARRAEEAKKNKKK